MTSLIYEFWTDQSGVIVSAEIVIVATVVVLGLIVGLNALQSAIVFELNDIARAFCSLNQSYWFSGFRGCKASVPGSQFTDINTCARLCYMVDNFAFVGGVSQGGTGGFVGMDFGVGAAAVPVAPPVTVAPPAPVVTPAPVNPCPPTSICPPTTTVPSSPCLPTNPPATNVCPPATTTAPATQPACDTCQPMSVIMPPGYTGPMATPPVLMIR